MLSNYNKINKLIMWLVIGIITITIGLGINSNIASAKYAVNHLKVNWNKQAIKVAKNYQRFERMSSHNLYEQLTSSYGDSFTPSQAKYAIKYL